MALGKGGKAGGAFGGKLSKGSGGLKGGLIQSPVNSVQAAKKGKAGK